MSIQVTMTWAGMTAEESHGLVAGIEPKDCCPVWFQENYHGGPYPSKYLLAEAYESSSGQAQIPALVLESRLGETIRLAIERQKNAYNEVAYLYDPEVYRYDVFVKTARLVEDRTGNPVTISVDW